MFIHLHPKSKQVPNVLRANGQVRGVSSTTFEHEVIKMALALALAMNEIHYEDRLDPMNHHPFFPVGFTAIIDTFPVYVAAPSDWRLNGLLFQPKCAALPSQLTDCVRPRYKAHVYKVQIAISFTQKIIFASFLHHGSLNDSRIFNETWKLHKMRPWEHWLADKIYNGCATSSCAARLNLLV